MANQTVVDELVVKFDLDSSDYQKKEKTINKLIDETEKKLKAVDTKQRERDKARVARQKETTKSLDALTAGFKRLALASGALLGLGGVGAIVGAITAFTGMETGLRRAAVATGLSNRELQAWGATARRLGADAEAGASAISELAKEQKLFNLTGNAPTLQGFARIGVQGGPETPILDILAQAQQRFREAPEGQRAQYEQVLTASGVSPDLVVALKSEKDIRETYAKSYAESTEENRKALDAVSDALATLRNSAAAVANSLITVLQPIIESISIVLRDSASELVKFNERVLAAGGGVEGFTKVLEEEAPTFAAALRILGQTIDVVTYGFQELWGAVKQLFSWIDGKISKFLGGDGKTTPLKDAIGVVGDAIKWAWTDLVSDSRRYGAAPVGKLVGDAGGARLSPPRIAPSNAPTNSATAQSLMTTLITQYGFDINRAAAIVANAEGESSLRPNAVSPDGGARGLLQWRGPRRAAFKKRYGIEPDAASVTQQLDFLTQDPEERRRTALSFNGKNGAAAQGTGFSKTFEAHGDVAIDAQRGVRAQQLATQFANINGTVMGGSAPTVGQQINVQYMTVQASNPADLGEGIKRQSGVQNYTSAVR